MRTMASRINEPVALPCTTRGGVGKKTQKKPTATVKLPNRTVLKRTLRQIALLEASFEDPGNLDLVTEERPVISTSDDAVSGGTPRAVPIGFPVRCGSEADIVREQKAHAKYPGKEGVTPSNPELATPKSSQDP